VEGTEGKKERGNFKSKGGGVTVIFVMWEKEEYLLQCGGEGIGWGAGSL